MAASALLAQVEGSVVNSSTGAPLVGAFIRIDRESESEMAYHSVSGPGGEFRIEAMATGDYTAVFVLRGFRQPDRDSQPRRPFHVAALGPTVHLEARMLPLARVSGRVLTASERPVPGAAVELIRAGFPVGDTTTADKQGNFSFDEVDPGTCLLNARAPRDAPPPAAGDGLRLGWVSTFYPSTSDRLAGVRIIVTPGAELAGFDIHLLALPLRRVSGTVLSPNGEPAPNVQVTLALPDEVSGPDVETTARTGGDGSFAFPGAYDRGWRLTAEAEAAGVKLRVQTALEVAGHDVEHLHLRLAPPFALTGKVVRQVPEGVPLPAGPAVGVMLMVRAGGDHVNHAVADASGNFRIEGIAPGAYTIRPISPGPPFYLDSVQLGTRDVTEQEVELTPDSLPVTITYNSDGGGVRGAVENCGGATVVLAPRDTALQSYEFIRQASCQADGRFEISSIRPGEYDAFAFDRAPVFLEVASFAGRYANQAVRVTVRAGEMTTASLKVTPRPAY
jgi:hypothetical protein